MAGFRDSGLKSVQDVHIYTYIYIYMAQWLRCCATNRKVADSIPAGVSGVFIDIKSFRSHYCPGVDSAPNRNEYQEHFLGERRPVRKVDNLPPSCVVVTKSGNLNFLEPSGPLQACNGTALTFTYFTANLRVQNASQFSASFLWSVLSYSTVHNLTFCMSI